MSVGRERKRLAAPAKEITRLDPFPGTKIVGCASCPLSSDIAAALPQVVPSGKERKVAIDRIFEVKPARA